jgi:hypothetical protein
LLVDLKEEATIGVLAADVYALNDSFSKDYKLDMHSNY